MGSVVAAGGLIAGVFISASSAGAAPKAAAPQGDGLPPGLQFNPMDMTHNNNLRYGEPEIAVNPRNPNNIVYHVMSQQLTYTCEAAADPNCVNDPLTGAALGEDTVPGWLSSHVYVSFDRGRTWTDVTSNLNQNSIPAPTMVTDSTGTHLVSHDDLLSRGDPMVTVTADGTFYIGWDSMDLGTIRLPAGFTFRGVVICPSAILPLNPDGTCHAHGLVDGGIAVSKSTDGGRTWSTPTLTGTGVDRPWMSTDLSTGTVYEASSGGVDSSMSTGDPLLPQNAPGLTQDRYVVSSSDGVTWSQPKPLGGGGFSGAGGSTISAANGVLAAGFQVGDENDAACQFFLSDPTATSPCTIFETSTDSGAHWSRHAVPDLANASGSILVAADPAIPGTYTVASTDPTTKSFQVYVTHDLGADWTGPAVVTDSTSNCPPVSASACKFKPWINYSPDGVLGLAWRSASVAAPAAAPAVHSASVLTSADVASTDATDPADQPLCDPLGCGVAPPDDENDLDPAPVPYTMWAAVSRNAGATFSRPLRVSPGASAPADPNMLTGTDDTSVIALSDSDVFVGWGQWPTGVDQQGLPLNLQSMFAAVKIPALTHP
jgi:hypothetical protein